MEKVYFESLPAITVASHRTVIPSFEDLGRLCYEVIGPEMARLGCECPEPGRAAGCLPEGLRLV